MTKFIWACFLLVIPIVFATKLHTCDRDYVKLGCFKEKATGMTLIVNDRDRTSPAYDGHMLDWKKFKNSIHSLACRCSEKAKEGKYTYFAIRFWAECWAGKKISDINLDPSNMENNCVNELFQTCDLSHTHECVGTEYSEYIYTIKDKSKDVDGGFSGWTNWTSCSQKCDGGIMERERSCSNPKPQGKGKDCSVLGETTEVKKCNEEPCQGTTFGPYKFVDEHKVRTQMTFVTDDQLKIMKQCPSSDLEIKTNLKFYIQQDDSKSESVIRYWRPDSNKVEEFKFPQQWIDHLNVVYDGFNLRCSGNAICNNRGLPKDKDVKAVVLSVDFNPRSGGAYRNQWFRNKYSLYGSGYSSSCKAAGTFGPYNFVDENEVRTQMTFVTDDQLKVIKQCPSSNLQINTNLTFYIQQDDSKSESEIKYWRPDSNTIQRFIFTHQWIDHLNVVYDGFYLRCSGHAICNDRGLPKDKNVKAVVLSVDFNPRSGGAYRNQWFRNKYSLYGSVYSTSCKAGK